MSTPASPPAGTRLVSLDVFRGATIVGMILVNNPGTWAAVYPPLLHAQWHGWTPTDLIFPFFLFIVGVSITLAFTRYLARDTPRTVLARKTWVRAAILFGLGLFMAAFPFITFVPEFGLRPGLGQLRIMGVLQRIALCYLAASLLFLYTRAKTQHLVLAALLLGYWAAMMLIPVPEYGAGQIDLKVGNLAAYLDRLILTPDHLWAGADRAWDPEGLFSTLPAIATTLLGVSAGRILLGQSDHVRRTARLFVFGFALLTLGYVWQWVFPLNKALWTSSYAVFTAGIAACLLALCYWVIEVQDRRKWTRPFVLYGVNAITVFFFSGLVGKALFLIRVPTAEGMEGLQSVLFKTVFAPLASPMTASLLYALVWITAWYGVLYLMDRKHIQVRV